MWGASGRGADTRVRSAETHLGVPGFVPREEGRDESRPGRQECLRHAGLAALLAALLLTAGCGYIGYPMVPLANVPNKINDLVAVQRGSTIIVHCTIPTLTTENFPIKAATKQDLRIGPAGTPFNSSEWAPQAKPVASSEVKDGILTYKIPTADWTGKTVALAVRSISAKGKQSDWSNFEIFRVVPPPPTPSQPTVQNTAQGEHIAWTGPGDQFRVLRRVGDEKEYTIAATVAGHEWTDTPIEYGKPYTYMVQALFDAGNKRLAESDLSEPKLDTPEDEFPPAVPAGLRADATANGVSLVWESDTDSDLAGYRVYRSEGSGPWQKLDDVSAVPSYSDTTAQHGKTYRYAISAFDKAAKSNESDRSAPVEIAFP